MFFSIMIVIHNMLSTPGVVRQIGLSSERTPKRAAPRAALAQRDGSIESPVSGYHEAHPAADLLPKGCPARQPAGSVAIATTGSPEAGPAAGRCRRSLGGMRGISSSPSPFHPSLSGNREMLKLGACAKRTRRQPAGGACALRPPPPRRVGVPAERVGDRGGLNGNRKRKFLAPVNRFSLQLGGFSRAAPLPLCRAPTVPTAAGPLPCPAPPATGGAPVPPPSLPGGAAGPSSPRPPARLSALRPRCPTRNSCGPSKTGTWMR